MQKSRKYSLSKAKKDIYRNTDTNKNENDNNYRWKCELKWSFCESIIAKILWRVVWEYSSVWSVMTMAATIPVQTPSRYDDRTTESPSWIYIYSIFQVIKLHTITSCLTVTPKERNIPISLLFSEMTDLHRCTVLTALYVDTISNEKRNKIPSNPQMKMLKNSNPFSMSWMIK